MARLSWLFAAVPVIVAVVIVVSISLEDAYIEEQCAPERLVEYRLEAEETCSNALRLFSRRKWALALEGLVLCANAALDDQFTSDMALASFAALTQCMKDHSEELVGDIADAQRYSVLLKRALALQPCFHGYYAYVKLLEMSSMHGIAVDTCNDLFWKYTGTGITGFLRDANHQRMLQGLVAECTVAHIGAGKHQEAIAFLNQLEGDLSPEEAEAVRTDANVVLAYTLAIRGLQREDDFRGILETAKHMLFESAAFGGDQVTLSKAEHNIAQLVRLENPILGIETALSAYRRWLAALPVLPSRVIASRSCQSDKDEWVLVSNWFDSELEWRPIGREDAIIGGIDEVAATRFVATTIDNAVMSSMKQEDAGTIFIFHQCEMFITPSTVALVNPPYQHTTEEFKVMQTLYISKATIIGQNLQDVEEFQRVQLPALISIRDSEQLLQLAPYVIADSRVMDLLQENGFSSELFLVFNPKLVYHVQTLNVLDLSRVDSLAPPPPHISMGPAESLKAAHAMLVGGVSRENAPPLLALFLGSKATGRKLMRSERHFVKAVQASIELKVQERKGDDLVHDSCMASFELVDRLQPLHRHATIVVGAEADVSFVSMDLGGVEYLISLPCRRAEEEASTSEVVAAKLGLQHRVIAELEHVCGTTLTPPSVAVELVATAVFDAMTHHCYRIL